MMTTSELLRIVDIPRDRLYYLEHKGYISPRKVPRGELQAREYSDEEVLKVKLIWKYLQQGFKHRVAYAKALEELGQATPGNGAAP
jgi:DNA-binding transcriptional MerR regulator